MLDPNLHWAFISIGLAFLFYGLDKILELGKPKNPAIKMIKTIVGFAIFGCGLFILIFLRLLT
jgi:uncharacterized membrane protein